MMTFELTVHMLKYCKEGTSVVLSSTTLLSFFSSHLVQGINLHFKSTDLYLFCTTKVFPKFLLPFQSQASFQSEQFGSYDYAARSLSLVACSLTSQRSRMLMQKKTLVHIATFEPYLFSGNVEHCRTSNVDSY